MNLKLSNTLIQWLALLFLAFIWGSSFILMKVGLKVFNAYHVAAIRVLISTIVLAPVGLKNFRKVKRIHIRPFLILGMLGIALPAFLFPAAQTHISSSMAGMLNSLTPICTLIIGVAFYQVQKHRRMTLGVIVGFFGAFLILVFSEGSQIGSFKWQALLVFLATVFYGITTNEVKTYLKNFSGIEITAIALVFTAPPVLVFSLISDYSYITVDDKFWVSLAAVATLSLLGTTLALIIFNSLIKHTTAVFASSVTYIVPAFAIFWGVIDGEYISVFSIIGISLVLYGVYLINRT